MKMQIVSFHCVLKNKFGKVISSTFNRDILTGFGSGHKQELVALAKALQNLTTGEKRSITLSAEEAYGFYDPKMVFKIKRQELPSADKTIVLDMDGTRRSFRVIDTGSDVVMLDGNHPLAGQDLVFEIETLAVRDATAEEISESTQVDHRGCQ